MMALFLFEPRDCPSYPLFQEFPDLVRRDVLPNFTAAIGAVATADVDRFLVAVAEVPLPKLERIAAIGSGLRVDHESLALYPPWAAALQSQPLADGRTIGRLAGAGGGVGVRCEVVDTAPDVIALQELAHADAASKGAADFAPEFLALLGACVVTDPADGARLGFAANPSVGYELLWAHMIAGDWVEPPAMIEYLDR